MTTPVTAACWPRAERENGSTIPVPGRQLLLRPLADTAVGAADLDGDSPRLGRLRRRDGHGQHTVVESRRDAVRVHELGESHRPFEAPMDALGGEHAKLALLAR